MPTARPTSNTSYLIAVLVMVGIGVAAIVAIYAIRPDKDNAAIIATVVALITPTTMALLAFMKAQETHLSVNSRLDAFMESAKRASHAEGREEGRLAGAAAADKRTDTLSHPPQN